MVSAINPKISLVPTLRETVRKDLNLGSYHLRGIDVIDSEDYSGVKRKVKEYYAKMGKPVSDEYLERGILALKHVLVSDILDTILDTSNV